MNMFHERVLVGSGTTLDSTGRLETGDQDGSQRTRAGPERDQNPRAGPKYRAMIGLANGQWPSFLS